jgi:serine/threonine protein kinase
MSSEIGVGASIGPARLERFLGEGAMGVVYLGQHLSLGIPVAVKLLKEDRINGDPRYLERFRREARLAARLSHPGLVRVLDFGEQGGTPWMVMEYVDGFTLDTFLRQRPGSQPETTILRVLAAVGSALGTAHGEGIVHRDLKPANILLDRKGRLKVADLGLAREDGADGLTRDRVAVGSPAYMAPETLTPGARADHRIDLYALGIIGYQMAFGRLPYSGSMSQIVHGHLGGRADWTLATTCSSPVLALLRRLMAVDPQQRPASGDEVLQEARRLMGSGSLRRKAADTSSQGEFSGLVRMLESGLGEKTSSHAGKTIVHTTKGERRFVWLLLVAVLGVAVAGFLLAGRHGSPSSAAGAQAAPAASSAALQP